MQVVLTNRNAVLEECAIENAEQEEKQYFKQHNNDIHHILQMRTSFLKSVCRRTDSRTVAGDDSLGVGPPYTGLIIHTGV